MEKSEFEDYLENRYRDQLSWYSKRSRQYKKWYHCLQVAIILLAAFLPGMTALVPEKLWIITLMSSLLAFLTAILKAFNFQEDWISYRTTAEALKREKYYYDAKIGDYSTTKNAEQLFVDRIEDLMSIENTFWTETHLKKESEEIQKGSNKS